MSKKKIKIKNKIINQIMINGEKKTSEKLFLKSCKNLLINSSKQTDKIIQLCLINSTPIFKLHQSFNKKLKKKDRSIKIMPVFVSNTFVRTALGINFIIVNLRKKNSNNSFYNLLAQEILLLSENKSSLLEMSKDIQEKALLNTRYIKHYRW